MNKKIKVIQLIDSLNPGGAEIMAVNIANELSSKKDVASHLCVTRLEGNLKAKIAPNVNYLFLQKKQVLDIKAIKMLYVYIKKNQITIIHAHSSSYFIGFLIKLWNPKLKLIWHNHYGNSLYLPYVKKILLFILSKSFDAVISVNNVLNSWALNYLKVSKAYKLPNFAEVNNKEKETTFLYGDDKKRIVCLANLRPEKDHLNLLKAFKDIHDIHPDWTLHLIGEAMNNGYAGEIKLFITMHNLSNHVFLYGSCSDVVFILRQCTIGVLSSNFEGLPVALLEYGLASLPVVITNVGECANVVAHEHSGLVVLPKDTIALTKALETLILDEQKRDLYGANLYESVLLNYSKSSFIKKLMSIYR
jgi:glycosyltransferase involved in cell wall biosynthesis